MEEDSNEFPDVEIKQAPEPGTFLLKNEKPKIPMSIIEEEEDEIITRKSKSKDYDDLGEIFRFEDLSTIIELRSHVYDVDILSNICLDFLRKTKHKNGNRKVSYAG